jgi:hypothetical protein
VVRARAAQRHVLTDEVDDVDPGTDLLEHGVRVLRHHRGTLDPSSCTVQSVPRRLRTGLAGLFLLLALTAAAAAGTPPDYAELQRGSVHVHFVPEDARLARSALDVLAETVEVYRNAGYTELPAEVRLYVCPSLEEFDRLAPGGGPLPRWAAAVAFPGSDTILLKRPGLEGASAEVRRTLIHEYAHLLFLHRLCGGTPHCTPQVGPRWLDEGLAMLHSGYMGLEDHLHLAYAALSGRWIPLAGLEDAFPADAEAAELAYLESVAAVRYLLAEHGQYALELLLRRLGAGASLDAAMQAAIGTDLEGFERAWTRRYRTRELMLPLLLGGTGFWAMAGLLLILAYMRKALRIRRTLRRWENEEDAEDAGTTEDPLGPVRAPDAMQSEAPASLRGPAGLCDNAATAVRSLNSK